MKNLLFTYSFFFLFFAPLYSQIPKIPGRNELIRYSLKITNSSNSSPPFNVPPANNFITFTLLIERVLGDVANGYISGDIDGVPIPEKSKVRVTNLIKGVPQTVNITVAYPTVAGTHRVNLVFLAEGDKAGNYHSMDSYDLNVVIPTSVFKIELTADPHQPNDIYHSYVTVGQKVTLNAFITLPGIGCAVPSKSELTGKDYANKIIFKADVSNRLVIEVTPTVNPTYYTYNMTCPDINQTAISNKVMVNLYYPQPASPCFPGIPGAKSISILNQISDDTVTVWRLNQSSSTYSNAGELIPNQSVKLNLNDCQITNIVVTSLKSLKSYNQSYGTNYTTANAAIANIPEIQKATTSLVGRKDGNDVVLYAY